MSDFLSNRLRYELSNMELDEISTVNRGDNPHADILIIKGDTCDIEGHDATDGHGHCVICGKGKVRKMMPGPSDVHHERPLSDDFKHKDKMRKKSRRRLRKEAEAEIEKMERIARRRFR